MHETEEMTGANLWPVSSLLSFENNVVKIILKVFYDLYMNYILHHIF